MILQRASASGHTPGATLHVAASNDWVYEIKDMIAIESTDVEAKDKVRHLPSKKIQVVNAIVDPDLVCESTPQTSGALPHEPCSHTFARRAGRRHCTWPAAKATSAPSRCEAQTPTLLADACPPFSPAMLDAENCPRQRSGLLY